MSRRAFMKLTTGSAPHVTPLDLLRSMRCRESGWIPWYAYL